MKTLLLLLSLTLASATDGPTAPVQGLEIPPAHQPNPAEKDKTMLESADQIPDAKPAKAKKKKKKQANATATETATQEKQ